MANLLVGSDASVLCKSDINAIKMEWLNSEGGVITSITDQKQLNLIFNPVHDANHSEVYTCRVTRNNGTGSKNVTVHQNFTLKARGISKFVQYENSFAPFYTFHAVPPNILRVNISQRGSGKAGEVYNLNCSILKKIDGLAHNPIATWIINGEDLQEGSDVNSVLYYYPLKTSHAGNYSCNGSLTSLAPPHQISALEYYRLKVSSE